MVRAFRKNVFPLWERNGSVVALTLFGLSCTSRAYDEDQAEVRLVGGSAARADEFPGVLRVDSKCTAAKVGQSHILIAKHCVRFLSEGSEIRVQTSYVSSGTPDGGASLYPEARLTVAKKWIHESADVAVLAVVGATSSDTSLFAAPKVAPISTNAEQNPIDAVKAATRVNQLWVVGFGCEARTAVVVGDPVLTSGSGVPGKPLKKNRCTDAARSRSDEIVCAAFESHDGIDPSQKPGLCDGDSGGPLFLRSGGTTTVVAVNSSYHPVGTSQFTRVDKASPLMGWVAARVAEKIP